MVTNGKRREEGRREADRWSIWDRRVRDLGIYIVALAGVINQLFFAKEPSETILVFLAAALGFPLVLRADEIRRMNRDDREHKEGVTHND
jgi:hypothetical protein